METIQQLPVRRVGSTALNQECFPSIINKPWSGNSKSLKNLDVKEHANHGIIKRLTHAAAPNLLIKKQNQGPGHIYSCYKINMPEIPNQSSPCPLVSMYCWGLKLGRPLHMLGKRYTTELHPQPFNFETGSP